MSHETRLPPQPSLGDHCRGFHLPSWSTFLFFFSALQGCTASWLWPGTGQVRSRRKSKSISVLGRCLFTPCTLFSASESLIYFPCCLLSSTDMSPRTTGAL